ncbi:hypothetical protein [Salibacterium aidingense]
MGGRRAEAPLGKAILFIKLAEVIPMESAGPAAASVQRFKRADAA